MPALSYKERFVPFVKEYSKRQSIRGFRNYLFKPGQTLMHYFGMRTKLCTKLIPNLPCADVKTIFILATGSVYLGPLMEKLEAEDLLKCLQKSQSRNDLIKLNDEDKDYLAYNDGFRPDGSNTINPTGCFALMFKWWNQTHDLPFCGQLIKW